MTRTKSTAWTEWTADMVNELYFKLCLIRMVPKKKNHIVYGRKLVYLKLKYLQAIQLNLLHGRTQYLTTTFINGMYIVTYPHLLYKLLTNCLQFND